MYNLQNMSNQSQVNNDGMPDLTIRLAKPAMTRSITLRNDTNRTLKRICRKTRKTIDEVLFDALTNFAKQNNL